MKIAIITHVFHIHTNNQYFGYAPYIREMNIWFKYVDEVIIVAPLVNKELNSIHEPYLHSIVRFNPVAEFNITSLKNTCTTLYKLPGIIKATYSAMKAADHIHLRCPGNMGLIGAVLQIFFPKKPKTAKYAGNWDPKSKQPFTYKLQRWILSNTFLTKNMQVLVYGDWAHQTKNIKPFFTATYSEAEVQNAKCEIRSVQDGVVHFLFIGTLSKGKQPFYAIQIVEALQKLGKKVTLDLYGDGVLRNELAHYITQKKLNDVVNLKGNQTKETVLKAYQKSHFLILPSKSEGWPKVVAEAMFWGCVPIVSPVSCVPYMVANGARGLLLNEKLASDVDRISRLFFDAFTYQKMSLEGQNWSQQYTTDKFESEIKKLLHP